jgi:glycosyltransferase involved in cell wall biosynthesis
MRHDPESTRLPRAQPMAEAIGLPLPVRVGVVVPVHNEERLLPSTLGCLQRAVDQIESHVREWRVVLVLDRCTDGSATVVERWRSAQPAPSRQRIEVVSVEAANVGTARRTGCEALLRHWSDGSPATVWLATTDGDSEVPPDWLSSQLLRRSQGTEVWIGSVAVPDWSGRAEGAAEEWHRRYLAEDLPVHGANLGIDGATYSRLGGFEDLATGEDRALVRRALDHGAVIHHDRSVRVATSSRRTARAPRGFAHALDAVEAMLARPPVDDARVAV